MGYREAMEAWSRACGIEAAADILREAAISAAKDAFKEGLSVEYGGEAAFVVVGFHGREVQVERTESGDRRHVHWRCAKPARCVEVGP